MLIDILTLFPKMFDALNYSVVGKAIEKGIINIDIIDFRNYSNDIHQHVDGYPFGGGAGMLLKAQPIFDAVEDTQNKAKKAALPKGKIILLDPAGKTFNEDIAHNLSKEEHLTFICGHYEGYDERIKTLVTDEYSLGDYILTGGELGSMVIIDATVRLLKGVLGNERSAVDESFSNYLLEYPQYTRPSNFRGMEVPAVLRSGDHQKIKEWRKKESLRKTYLKRPDLIDFDSLSKESKRFLIEIKNEENNSHKN